VESGSGVHGPQWACVHMRIYLLASFDQLNLAQRVNSAPPPVTEERARSRASDASNVHRQFRDDLVRRSKFGHYDNPCCEYGDSRRSHASGDASDP
jgi:hypothetical protein